MAVDIWQESNGANYICSLREKVWRLVESQEVVSTRKLVDSFEELLVLEEMLAVNKLSMHDKFQDYHPLLSASFKYPPLKYGSRFGKKTEPGLWYGSLQLKTAMAEKAFYKFNFLRASKAEYDFVVEGVTAFSVRVATTKGIKLDVEPFKKYISSISAPTSYERSQLLGAVMRMRLKLFLINRREILLV